MATKQSILIVDDKKENLVAMRQALEGVDAQIVEARSGNEALAATLDRHFAMAILDVIMPGMDGYELAGHLRGDAKTSVIPIVFVTASYADEQHMFEGYDAGGIDYIVKPFDPRVLIGKVRVFLELDRHREELRQHRDHLEALVETRTAQLEHLNVVLSSIRDVNKLIVREKGRDRLIRGACENLVRTRGFHGAWIVLNDRLPDGVDCAQVGLAEAEFAALVDRIREARLPRCCRQITADDALMVTRDPAAMCGLCPLAQAHQGNGALTVALRHEGREFGWLGVSVPPAYMDAEQEASLLREIASDIAFALHGIETETERKAAEKMLKEAYDIINRSPAVAFTWKNAEGWPVAFVSENVQKLLGYRAEAFILGQVSYIDCIHVQDLPRVAQEVARMSAQEKTVAFVHEPYRVIAKDGAEKTVRDWTFIVRDNDGRITHYKGIVEDITEQQSLEAQMRQAQKMEAVGRLAGGVAHDFNNILSVILGYSELAMEKMGTEDPLRDDLAEIHAAAIRSKDITRQLLAFARKETIAPEVLDLNATVESMLKILRKLIGEDINLAWHPGKVPWPVLMDPSQIDQILANLCVNARDAIADVGRIAIETGAATIDADYCSKHEGCLPGDFTLLAVSDDGCGMNRETMDHIFEPFFTTKGVGKGTGLGLSTVYGIVKQSNGFINAYSEPGQGTVFRIYLPRHSGDISGKQRIIDERVPNGNGETVLVVEDDRSILELVERILFRCNYKVLSAKSPSEALAVAQAHPGEISLLISDVVMPGMNGRELADRLKALCPGIKCLFMSGYTANVIAHRGILDEGVNFVQKPFSKRDLAVKVRKALES